MTSLVGCSSEPKKDATVLDSVEIPNMVTFDVNMLISDSGVIKYKAITPAWYVFENDVKNKYWYFPQGIRLDQIDSTFTTEFNIEADTAYNYETKQLWHLIKNVKVHSVSGEYFETNDLYWDLKKHEVYSDSFIHIERADAIIEGFGFKSDDAFSVYELRETSGIFPIQDDALATPAVKPADAEIEEVKPEAKQTLVESTPKPAAKAKPANFDRKQKPIRAEELLEETLSDDDIIPLNSK